jgi:CRP/FNR family transcriptional regulator, cyclic AMP receptor protein
MVALRAVPLFASLAPEELSCLARAGLERHFAPNDVLCLEGEPGDEVFVLLTGEVAILRRDGDEQKVIAREKAGGFVGEMAVIDPAPRSATVVAGEGGATALCVDGGGFRDIVEANPSVARGVMRALSARIRSGQAAPLVIARAAAAQPTAGTGTTGK